MRDEAAASRWRTAEFVLAELLLLTLLSALAVAIWGARALPWTTEAERNADANREVADAATRGVDAFLDVDYREIDDRSKRVLDLSTGLFRQQYGNQATDLRIATVRAKSVTDGTVRAVGVHGVEGSSANALVAADTVVRSALTKDLKASKSCPHAGAQCDRYRFLVTLTRVGDRWLMSDLAEVP